MKDTIKKWAKILVPVCGGWWSVMSGSLSIPLAFLALFWPDPRKWFMALALIALWIFAIRVAYKNYQMGDYAKRKTIDDAISKRKKQDALAELYQKLSSRIISIRSRSEFDFANSLNDGQDLQSSDLINEIATWIESNISRSEMIFFRDVSKIQFSPSEGSGSFGWEQRNQKRRMLDHLNLWSDSLKTAIDKFNKT